MDTYYDIYVVLTLDGQESEEYYDGGIGSIEDCKEIIQRLQSNEYRIYKVIRNKELADTVHRFKEDVDPEPSLKTFLQNGYRSDDVD